MKCSLVMTSRTKEKGWQKNDEKDSQKSLKEIDEMNILGKAKALLKRLSKELERGLLKRSLNEDEKDREERIS